MFTVLAKTRNSNSNLMMALVAALIVIIAMTLIPSLTTPKPALTTLADAQMAHDLFRQEELSLYNRSTASSIGGAAFYEYRRGEWSVGSVDAIGEFRQEELALYNHSAASSIGSPAFYDYRRGEWFGN